MLQISVWTWVYRKKCLDHELKTITTLWKKLFLHIFKLLIWFSEKIWPADFYFLKNLNQQLFLYTPLTFISSHITIRYNVKDTNSESKVNQSNGRKVVKVREDRKKFNNKIKMQWHVQNEFFMFSHLVLRACWCVHFDLNFSVHSYTHILTPISGVVWTLFYCTFEIFFFFSWK